MVAAKSLQELQVAQRNHDHLFHRDVFHLSSPERVKHYCLHFAKYVGRIARETGEGTELKRTLQATLTDAMIISLAFSDVLNVDLDGQLEEAFGNRAKPGLEGWVAVIDSGKKPMGLSEIRSYAFERGASATGELCKVAESLDHIESLEPRSLLLEGLVAWLAVILVCAHHLQFDLVAAVEARWKDVERKRVT
jgi:hypothetical protein